MLPGRDQSPRLIGRDNSKFASEDCAVECSPLEQLLRRYHVESAEGKQASQALTTPDPKGRRAMADTPVSGDVAELQHKLLQQHEQRLGELEQLFLAHRHDCRVRLNLMDDALCRLLANGSSSAASANNGHSTEGDRAQRKQDSALSERLSLLERCVLELSTSMEAIGTSRSTSANKTGASGIQAKGAGAGLEKFMNTAPRGNVSRETPLNRRATTPVSPRPQPNTQPPNERGKEEGDNVGSIDRKLLADMQAARGRSASPVSACRPDGKSSDLVSRLQAQQSRARIPSMQLSRSIQAPAPGKDYSDMQSSIASLLSQPLISTTIGDDKIRNSASTPFSQLSTRVPSPCAAGWQHRNYKDVGVHEPSMYPPSSSTSMVSRSSSDACMSGQTPANGAAQPDTRRQSLRSKPEDFGTAARWPGFSPAGTPMSAARESLSSPGATTTSSTAC
mmetsp:Transcript_52246/g.124595  ORF Transcript_52246/g.124595 Transcript_52246/m.124595 type:complete len:449 (-) Transcript_52246:138-1484(-)